MKKSTDIIDKDVEWDKYDQTYNKLSTQSIKPKTTGTSNGWRQIDGKRCHQTFRQGKKVIVEGNVAFKAYLGDSKSKKSKLSTSKQ